MPVALILCPGPSADPSKLPAIHGAGSRVYACNHAIRLYRGTSLRPYCWCTLDHPQLFDREPWLDPEQRKATSTFKAAYCEAYGYEQGTEYYQFEKSVGVHRNPFSQKLFQRPYKCPLFAWQLAVREGATTVATYGIDGRLKPDGSRYGTNPETRVSERHRKGVNGSYQTTNNRLVHWRRWIPEVRHVNLSPESVLSGHWETMAVEEFLRKI